jgi:hypothetical protein
VLRGRSKRSAAVSSAVAALFFALIAGPATAGQERVVDAQFSLGEDSGYRVDFAAIREDGGGAAYLIAQRALESSGFSAFYVKPRAVDVTARRVVADFGAVGRVSVRFHERDRDLIEPPKGCEGRSTQRYGTFRGRFRFRGEHGFASVRGVRAQGQVLVGPPLSCEIDFGERRASHVQLTTCGSSRAPTYLAERAFGAATHTVGVNERRNGLIVLRDAYAFGEPETLSFSGGLESATVDPPSPFRGTAEFADGRLTGDLTAPLPGLERPVRITPSRASLDRLQEGESFGCDEAYRVPAFLDDLLP